MKKKLSNSRFAACGAISFYPFFPSGNAMVQRRAAFGFTNQTGSKSHLLFIASGKK
jgi:hypothetical protein